MTGQSSAASECRISIGAPTELRNIAFISAMTEFKSASTGSRCCLRAKARSDWVSSAPRDAPRCAVCNKRRLFSSEIRTSSSSSEPDTAVRRLLKSWAIPPVSWPTASIFCACTSAVCACSRAPISVRSRALAAASSRVRSSTMSSSCSRLRARVLRASTMSWMSVQAPNHLIVRPAASPTGVPRVLNHL